jgi:hypothetical protein
VDCLSVSARPRCNPVTSTLAGEISNESNADAHGPLLGVYGTIYEKGKTTLIGDPPPAVAAKLGKLWKKEWRSQAQ